MHFPLPTNEAFTSKYFSCKKGKSPENTGLSGWG
jgi:hypothetical protein